MPTETRGHRVVYTLHADGRLTADCGCGWTYTNSVYSDVRQHARWHRQGAPVTGGAA